MKLAQRVSHAIRSRFGSKSEMIPATDLWSRWADEHNLKDLIPAGYLVYGELVGFTPDGAPIQKGYTYEQEQPGKIKTSPAGIGYMEIGKYAELYIYRVATVTPEGVVTDLSWPATKQFAKGLGLKTVPELWHGTHSEFTANDWIDKEYFVEHLANTMNGPSPYVDTPIALSDPGTVDEGVVVRYDGPNGIYLLKAKSPIFLGWESARLDEGAEDLEAEEVAS
jgi:hypothetical protein